MKTLTIKIPEGMDAKLTALATQQGQSKSAMVRMAIEQIVESNGQKNNTSALDQIADLVGCVEGAKDLSYADFTALTPDDPCNLNVPKPNCGI